MGLQCLRDRLLGDVMVPGIDCSGTKWAQGKTAVELDSSEYRVPWQQNVKLSLLKKRLQW